jgi:hypothetical protein
MLGTSKLVAQSEVRRLPQNLVSTRDGNTRGDSLSRHLKLCAGQPICLRLVAENGSVLAANSGKVLLPTTTMFRDETEVQKFQRRAGISSAVVGGIRIELQPAALKSFLAAREQARLQGLDITPRSADSSRRSYEDTANLWRSRVNAGLEHWVKRGKLTELAAKKLRSLSLSRQVSEVLALEAKRIYFGTTFDKSILNSVAAPGASQHNLLLALDIKQHANSQIRAILAQHGWFQTIRNDAPHFTYLGVAESALAARGLRRENSGGRTVWVPNVRLRTPETSASTNGNAGGKKSAGSKDKTAASNVGNFGPSGKRIVAEFSPNVIIRKEMESLLHKLTQLYHASAGESLHITSAYRSPERQARAMYQNILKFGYSYVEATYRNSSAVNEILTAYRLNHRNGAKAIWTMTKVIKAQIKRGVYISDHLLGRAFDIRLSANRATLSDVVHKLGGRLGVEADHYHVEF